MSPKPRLGAKARTAAVLGAGAVVGGVLAGTLSASAAGSSGTTTSTTPSYAAPAAGSGTAAANNFSSTPVRTDESAPATDLVATLTKKAEAAVPGGTVYRVESDAGDAAYEAHMKKADGTLVTVKFDKSLNVLRVEQGMGLGDPGQGRGAGPQGAPGASSSSGTSSG
jgi:Pyruvate/2-oxoacid:ferredoxin oxidoreductase gamma subunit